jgi:hypothetical protein
MLEGSIEVCQHTSHHGQAPVVEENLCQRGGHRCVGQLAEDGQAPNTTNININEGRKATMYSSGSLDSKEVVQVDVAMDQATSLVGLLKDVDELHKVISISECMILVGEKS